MIITEIKKNKNAPGYAVFADGEFIFSLSGETVLEENLKRGVEISEDRVNELKFKSDFYKAREKALRLLDRRAHSKTEIIRKLSANFSKEVAIFVADNLEEIGLINDEDFARLYFRELSEYKRFGIRRIQTELFKRGISRDIIDLITEENTANDDYLKIIEQLQKKVTDLSDEKIRRRTVSKFLRMGFSYEDIKTAFSIYDRDFTENSYD